MANHTLNIVSVIDSKSIVKSSPLSIQQSLIDRQYVTAQDGGELEVLYKGDVDAFCLVKLEILPDTISKDCEIELSLNSELLRGKVDMTLHPHGIKFAKPALLNIVARNLDLTGIDTKTITLYYDNPQTANWELVKVESIVVSEKDGSIVIEGGQLPHFSRYVLAYRN